MSRFQKALDRVSRRNAKRFHETKGAVALPENSRLLDAPLTVEVNNGELVVRIGVNTLAISFSVHEDNNVYDHIADGFRRTWKVVDAEEFARIVGNQLCKEDEIGNTPVTKLLDEACFLAVEDTTAAVEDGRLDPPDDWTHLEGSTQ